MKKANEMMPIDLPAAEKEKSGEKEEVLSILKKWVNRWFWLNLNRSAMSKLKSIGVIHLRSGNKCFEFISNSKNMDNFCNIYDLINT